MSFDKSQDAKEKKYVKTFSIFHHLQRFLRQHPNKKRSGIVVDKSSKTKVHRHHQYQHNHQIFISMMCGQSLYKIEYRSL